MRPTRAYLHAAHRERRISLPFYTTEKTFLGGSNAETPLQHSHVVRRRWGYAPSGSTGFSPVRVRQRQEALARPGRAQRGRSVHWAEHDKRCVDMTGPAVRPQHGQRGTVRTPSLSPQLPCAGLTAASRARLDQDRHEAWPGQGVAKARTLAMHTQTPRPAWQRQGRGKKEKKKPRRRVAAGWRMSTVSPHGSRPHRENAV